MTRKMSTRDCGLDETGAIHFGERLAASKAFKTLFADGMALVERTATYLDGEGREEARRLPRDAALAYAAESMRLTTRLMQIASWLLVQRAVNEGEMTQAEAAPDHRRTRLTWQPPASPSKEEFPLPAGLRCLVESSLRMQARIVHLDTLISGEDRSIEVPRPLEEQMAQLREAFR